MSTAGEVQPPADLDQPGVRIDSGIVEGSQVVLEPGMCFSIEPGVYSPGRHGARIEDIVVVTDGGVERLDTIDRELVVVGA